MASPSQLPSLNTMTNKKRTADGGPVTPALKRRKASAMSISSSVAGSAHPLRQTSFPPDDPTTSFHSARSPSADMDMDNMSLVSGSQVSAAPKKKRGRKSKAEKAREQTPSVVGGRGTASLVSGTAGGKSTTGGGGKNNEEEGADDDNDGPTEVAATAAALTKEQKEEEHRMRGLLISAFSPDQFDRFENWRAANLSKASVRRLVNATISQSVAENVVIGMRAVAKVFIGDIIESARRVQGEWIEKTGEKQTDLPTPPATAAPSPSVDTIATQTLTQTESQPGTQTETQTETQTATQTQTQQTAALNAEVEDRRGPLRPEHLREAMRRYRAGLEGGGVGMQGLWHQQQQSGVERFPTRTGGRRIFR
ncbi:hTAFII28-like protein conserved region-domain-containing protein [Podospora australis]|uniref:HTAFII28-like protein conserved region-domain-containing protein n=1 Tax=Podospora australis TaxID=1536484 RepID=A0AAN7AER1_9PEZI|nr:hTAFII28-like protein conserved region-domain-containing protein [Podospora australis]